MSPLLVAALVVFLEGLSFGVILPVLTPFAQELGGSVTWAGILFAASTLPRVLAAPLWGRVSDRFGRRPAMVLVAMGTTSASILWAMAERWDGVIFSGLAWLLASRLVYGAFAAQSVLGMAVASDVSQPHKRAAAMGVLGAAFGIAFTIGPALGGTFAERFGSANVGWMAGAFQACSILVALLLLRETRPTPVEPGSGAAAYVRPRNLLHLARAPVVAMLIAVTVISTAAYSILFPTIQPLAEGWYGWSPRDVGWALSAFGLIGALVQGGLVRQMVKSLGERTVAVWGLGLLGAGLLLIAAHPGQPAGLWAALTLVAIGTGLCVPTITALMSLSVDDRDQGAVHGLNQSATSIGRSVGFGLSGALFVYLAPAAAYGVAAGAAGAAVVLLAFVRPVHHEPEAEAERALEATADEIP